MQQFSRVRSGRALATGVAMAVCAVSIGSRAQTAPSRPHAFCPGTNVESEPNDTPATATPLTVTDVTRGIGGGIQPAGDVDFYRVPAQAGHRLWLSVDSGRSSGTPPFSRDTVVEVYAPDGATLLERDDDDGTANGGDASIESPDASVIAGLLLPSAGDYFVRVSAKSPSTQIAPYTLLIVATHGSVPEQEPNDTPAQATGSWSQVPFDATLSSASDVDYYRLDLLDAGQPFVVVDGDPERDGVGTDTVLEWVTASNPPTLVARVDSSGSTGTPAPPAEGAIVADFNARYVRIKGPAAGTYRVGVLWSGYCSVPVLLEKIEIE